MKVKKRPGTIGVRFLDSPNRIYSYKVRNLNKVVLGQELVADTEYGTKVVVVVRIDTQLHAAATKYIERKVAQL